MLNFLCATTMCQTCDSWDFPAKPGSVKLFTGTATLLLILWMPVSCSQAQRFMRSRSVSAAANNQKAQGYLGIEFHDLFQPSSLITRLHASHEVEIVMVDHDGPAGKAGLRSHDLVESLNGQPVSSAEALRQMIHDAGAGATISIAILRSGRAMNLSAQLESREDVDRRARARFAATEPAAIPDEAESDEAHSAVGTPLSAGARGKRFLGEVLHGPSIGLQLETMPPQLAMFFGAPTSSGLLIASVEAGSPAAVAGLEAGDVLLRADSVALRTVSDWTKRLHASKGRALTIVVLREHRELTLNLQPNGSRSGLDWPFRL